MISMLDLYRRLVVPVLTAIVVLGVASVALLRIGEPPRRSRVDPADVLVVVTALLAVFGAALPLLLLSLVVSDLRRASCSQWHVSRPRSRTRSLSGSPDRSASTHLDARLPYRRPLRCLDDHRRDR
ncbi:MAG: hypothetical protein ACOYEV_00640 [Candidatus Nanopelagicales bacterium]